MSSKLSDCLNYLQSRTIVPDEFLGIIMTAASLLTKLSIQIDEKKNFFYRKTKCCITNFGKHCIRILNKDTDLVSSIGILAITTCLLAAKIFQGTPQILPRLARIVYNFGGIIWLNVQVRDFLKSGRDFFRAIQDREANALLETAAKVFVKGTNILLTSFFFTASVAAACGFPQLATAIYLTLRPLSLVSLATEIINEVKDYFCNEAILKKLEILESTPQATQKIVHLMIHFFQIFMPSKSKASLDLTNQTNEYKLASSLVRQLGTQTIETFIENPPINSKTSPNDYCKEALKSFFAVKDSMLNKQACTKANLGLTALGYLSMGICRAYPDSLIEMAVRWGMSVLWTDELIRYKLFQSDLAAFISRQQLTNDLL